MGWRERFDRPQRAGRGCCSGGAPPRLAELALTLSILRLAPLPPDADRAAVTTALRAFEASRLGAYEAAGPVGDLAPFCWWAGVVMERDLSRWVGRADLPWLTEGYLEEVRAWTPGWREEANGRP